MQVSYHVFLATHCGRPIDFYAPNVVAAINFCNAHGLKLLGPIYNFDDNELTKCLEPVFQTRH